MISIALASWLATQTWCWDKNVEPDVVAYRMYWGATGTTWCEMNKAELAASACTTDCCVDVPEPQFPLTFFMVVAVDAAGNVSATEHGAIVTCP